MQKRKVKLIILPILAIVVLYLFSTKILTSIGEFLIVDESPKKSDAIVVLDTGIDYYPRMVEAARLYNQRYAKSIVINGNRKTDSLRELEEMGFESRCPWYEDRVRMLEMLGVPQKSIILISAEDVYDSVSESKVVGKDIINRGISDIIIVTSKSHSRRAVYIWRKTWPEKLDIMIVSAKDDPYSPDGWWKSGRQVKWVLSEYGAWLYFFWKSIRGS